MYSGVNASSKLGDEAPKGERCSPPHRGRGLERGNFCFVISKWHILVNSEVLNLKFFFIVSSPSGVQVDSVANSGFSSNAMNKRRH